MGSNNRPIGLRHLQLGGKALRPLGLLGVVVASFNLFPEERADELPGALVKIVKRAPRFGTRGSRFIISARRARTDEIKERGEKSTPRMYVTRGGGGLLGDGSRNPRRSACYSPSGR